MKELEGKRVTLWLKKPKFRYRGKVISVDEEFIHIHDEVDDVKRFISITNIAQIESEKGV